MGNKLASSKSTMKSSTITAVITRADGTVEELGTIAYWHKNPLRRWAWKIKQTTARVKTFFNRSK